MPNLNLALLGQFHLTLEHPIATRAESDKVRGLLAFLAVEHDRPHSRTALAELLWPGQPEQATAANFRRVLANLRAVIGDRGATIPHLRITRTTVQFDSASDAFVDVVLLRDLLKAPTAAPTWADHMEQAIALYRGPFLEGFTLPGCPEFERWVVDVRSELDHLVGGALHDLADHCYGQGDIARALALYRRSLLLNPYDEAVHRKIMLAYAAAGQRGGFGRTTKHTSATCRTSWARSRKRRPRPCMKRCRRVRSWRANRQIPLGRKPTLHFRRPTQIHRLASTSSGGSKNSP